MTPRRAIGLAALAALVVGGCQSHATGDREIATAAEVTEVAPRAAGASQVRQAVARLQDRVLRRFPPWPGDLPRSQDFPELPLVEIAPVQDRSGLAVDRALLERTLANAVQERRNLRLLADERAVPPLLRDDPSPREADAGLILRGWAGRDGRFHLAFGRRDAAKPWLEVASDPPEPLPSGTPRRQFDRRP